MIVYLTATATATADPGRSRSRSRSRSRTIRGSDFISVSVWPRCAQHNRALARGVRVEELLSAYCHIHGGPA